MHKILSTLKMGGWLCCILLGFGGLAACGGTLEIQVALETQTPQSRLGKIAYITGGDLWTLDLDSRAQARLTRDGYNSSPQWSPSGQYIAFLKRNRLWVADTRSQKASQLDSGVIDWFRWSPIEDRLAYSSESAGLILYEADDQVTQGLLGLSPGITQENFVWSADGGALFFNQGSIQAGKYAVSLEKVALDPRETVSLYTSDDLGNLPRLALPSPDGHWLAFWRWDTVTPSIEEQGLPVCLLSLQDHQPICIESQTLPLQESLTWSATGKLALVTQDPGTANSSSLVILDPERMVQQAVGAFGDRSMRDPAWSAEGGKIALSVMRNSQGPTQEAPPGSSRIWVIDISDSKQTPLTNDPRYRDDLPLWSKDGKEILFARLGEDEASLWMMQANGRGLHQVVPELTPRPEPTGIYGAIDWQALWDWWRPEDQ